MSGIPKAASISVQETLTLLDDKFSTFADGVAHGLYAFWLGSGISRERLPMLPVLVERVLEFLRSRADTTDPACPYNIALGEALGLANLSEKDVHSIDRSRPVNLWPLAGAIKERLSSSYEKLLDIEVGNLAEDVLVWEAIDVAGTYSDPSVEPDAEHLCIAVLIREGLVDELASANWDGLIEKAVEALSGRADALAVCVQSSDLQKAQHRPKLIKFHGCAVHARDDEETYRKLIIGRSSQIADWCNNPQAKAILSHLVTMIGERPSLMLGLSVQDFNIQNLFGKAKETLKWPWPGDRPSYVFSEEKVAEGQKALLKIVYNDEYTPDTRGDIQTGAHLQAFAKPLLLALIFYTLTEKFSRIAGATPGGRPIAITDWIHSSLKALRDHLANADDGDHQAFTKDMIAEISRLRRLTSIGMFNDDDTTYEPLTNLPVSAIEATAEMQSSGMPEAAVAAAILGSGLKDGLWKLERANDTSSNEAMARVRTADRDAWIFVAATTRAETEFYARSELQKGGDLILLRSQPSYVTQVRSSMKTLRNGKPAPIEITVPDLLRGTDDPAVVMERFCTEAIL